MMTIIDEEASEKRHPIRPEYINTSQRFWDAFGNVETEASAQWIVKLCQQSKSWKPFTAEEIEQLYRTSKRVNFVFNRLVHGEHGFVVLGGDGKYRVTHEFICRCFSSSPDFPSLP